MPGEPLMCIWQAVFANDMFQSNGVKKTALQGVLQSFEKMEGISYSDGEFEQTFTESEVDFDNFIKYVKSYLCSPWLPMPLLIENLEVECWEISKNSYRSTVIKTEEIGKLWRIFSRLCDEGTYPPTISEEQANFLFREIEKNLGTKGFVKRESISAEVQINFVQLLEMLDEHYFSKTLTFNVTTCIEEINKWLVKEVLKTGWLYKRTKKGTTWSNWQKRCIVLTPGKLTYYDQDKEKGTFFIYKQTTLEKLDDYRFFITYKNRFKISNNPAMEIELSAENTEEKDAWCNSIQVSIQALKDGVTPRMSWFKDSNENKRSSKCAAEKSFSKSNQSSVDEETYIEDWAEIMTKNIRAVFVKIDKDGNGRIDNNEFVEFLYSLGAKVTLQEAKVIFQAIDKNKDNTICFEEFLDYFVKFVILETKECNCECKLRKAFLQADRDKSGALNFQEFSQYVFAKNRAISFGKLMNTFDKLDKTHSGEINFDDFKDFFKNEPIFQEFDITSKFSTSIEDVINRTYEDTEVECLAELLSSRWKKFTGMKRTEPHGDLLMPDIVNDTFPRKYSLLDLACFNDLLPIEPKSVKVVGVNWYAGSLPERPGRVVFPRDFDGVIPTEIATNETLSFYGASLATGNQVKVSLLFQHSIQDFTNENNYLEQYVTAENALGGAGLEKHDFAHFDCPFEGDSGFFILGKMEKDVLHLTAFKVPTRHTIYVPQGVIHSNDYLKGTWRTMLSDEANIDHVQLVRMHKNDKVEEWERFTFSFPALV